MFYRINRKAAVFERIIQILQSVKRPKKATNIFLLLSCCMYISHRGSKQVWFRQVYIVTCFKLYNLFGLDRFNCTARSVDIVTCFQLYNLFGLDRFNCTIRSVDIVLCFKLYNLFG